MEQVIYSMSRGEQGREEEVSQLHGSCSGVLDSESNSIRAISLNPTGILKRTSVISQQFNPPEDMARNSHSDPSVSNCPNTEWWHV